MDSYMIEFPPGSRSGKHRHMAEEFLYVLGGKGYDLHWDVLMELGQKFEWHINQQSSRWDWEEGDIIYIPPNTVHQHFNADASTPARLISGMNRMVKYMGFNDLEQYENAPEYDANSAKG